MIDLGCTRSEMLAEIGASPGPERLADPSDPRFPGCEEARLIVGGRPRRELFRLLEFSLSARFAGAPRSERIRDLLIPLRCALGNAHKHGNRRDRSRRIEVEIVTSRHGALLAIGDEGEGFDAPSTVERMRAGEPYFTQQGSGLRVFEDARSRISWEAGGRMLLIRFLPSSGRESSGEGERISRALEAELASVGRDANAPALEVCGVIVEAGDAPAPLRVRCMLRELQPEGALPEVRILSGRLFEDGASARADLAAAAHLRQQLPDAAIEIPPPIGRLRNEPRLALYDFDPWLDLGEYLAQRGAAALPGVARRVGTLLAALQQSGGDLLEERWDALLDRMRSSRNRVARSLEASGAPQAWRARSCARDIDRRLARCEPRESAPVLGSFGLHCVHYGVDGRFSLDRFGGLRRSHPGIDLGAFLADLRQWTAASPDAEGCDAGWELLRSHALAGRPDTTPLDHAPVFAANELFSRLEPRLGGTDDDASKLLDRIELCLRQGGEASRAPVDARPPAVRSSTP